MQKDVTDEVKELREKLDSYIPKLRAKIQSSKDYKNDQEYKGLVADMQFLEAALEEKLSQDQPMIDEEIRGRAAKYEATPEPAAAPLLPKHLRYMARQLSQILLIRKYDPAVDLGLGDEVNWPEDIDGLGSEMIEDPAETIDTTTEDTL